MADPAMPPHTTIVVNLHTASENARSRLAAAGTEQEPKGDVHYRSASGADRCGACEYGRFKAGASDGSCTRVAGTIRSQMLCDLYESKTSEIPEASPKTPA